MYLVRLKFPIGKDPVSENNRGYSIGCDGADVKDGTCKPGGPQVNFFDHNILVGKLDSSK